MIDFIRTNEDDLQFKKLEKLSEKELRIREGDIIHDFLGEKNAFKKLNKVLLLIEDNQPIGSGAIREFDKKTVEIKKVFVKQTHQKKDLA